MSARGDGSTVGVLRGATANATFAGVRMATVNPFQLSAVESAREDAFALAKSCGVRQQAECPAGIACAQLISGQAAKAATAEGMPQIGAV